MRGNVAPLEHGLEEDTAPLWRALADPTRRRILDLLRERPRVTGEIAAQFPISRIAVMRHLEVLSEAGLAVSRKRGRQRWHYLNTVPLQKLHRRWAEPAAAGFASALLRLQDTIEAEGRHMEAIQPTIDIAQDIEIDGTPAAVFAARGDAIACVITEACPANMGVVPPAPGFNALLASLCRSSGAVLIMDEVLTGFRVSPSGWYGLDGVPGDLVTFGKVMGGGLPAAAFGGGARIMSHLAPAGPVYQAGTLSGNPLAVAAGLATLRACTPDVYARVDAAAGAVAELASSALTAAGVPFYLSQAGSLFSVFLGRTEPVRSFADARDQSPAAYAAFFHAMLDGGVYLPPSPYEAWFLSAAHDEAALSRVADALPAAARAAAAALSADRPGQA